MHNGAPAPHVTIGDSISLGHKPKSMAAKSIVLDTETTAASKHQVAVPEGYNYVPLSEVCACVSAWVPAHALAQARARWTTQLGSVQAPVGHL